MFTKINLLACFLFRFYYCDFSSLFSHKCTLIQIQLLITGICAKKNLHKATYHSPGYALVSRVFTAVVLKLARYCISQISDTKLLL